MKHYLDSRYNWSFHNKTGKYPVWIYPNFPVEWKFWPNSHFTIRSGGTSSTDTSPSGSFSLTNSLNASLVPSQGSNAQKCLALNTLGCYWGFWVYQFHFFEVTWWAVLWIYQYIPLFLHYLKSLLFFWYLFDSHYLDYTI